MRSTLAAAFLLSASSASSVPVVRLNNGVEMPIMAFAAQVWHPDVCANATALALQAGFNFIWSSALVGADCQKAQGETLKHTSVPRAELFVAGTVNDPDCGSHDACYEKTKQEAANQFNVLQQSQLDMIMLDYPASAGCDAILGQWRAFEELYAAKAVRSIAVSNFDKDQLECIRSSNHTAMPAVNQLSFSIGKGKEGTVEDNAKFGVAVQAYSPLGSGSLATDATCEKIGKPYGKSAVQVALKWILQRNVSIATQSTKLEHLQSDLDLFDFTLTDAELRELDNYHPTFVI
eukprot:TRINITY_DN84826_c0_g1_i1.p1 TRINITY_DN84826_c0_g1~~TRINITY_DN84826_c0_g1_i1.p1  ORF type:complete len:313 (-),score=71.57 TRINITY_DN84826_c0_g1_i1:346-1218(-)